MGNLEEKKVEAEVITAVYKAYLHCPQCARDIRNPLLRTPGVHSVDVKFEKGEITVKGAIDAKKIHGRIEKWSKKKVELVSQAKVKADSTLLKENEIKKESIKTTKIKAFMHCDKCEHDLRRKLLKHKGIHNVKTDIKAQTIVIEGIIESEKILAYMQKTVHKHAEIILAKVEKKEEKKVEVKEKEEKKVEVKEKVTETTTKIVEFKEVKKVEAKTKEGTDVPYFVHYVYAPQFFSDENPNACSIM